MADTISWTVDGEASGTVHTFTTGWSKEPPKLKPGQKIWTCVATIYEGTPDLSDIQDASDLQDINIKYTTPIPNDTFNGIYELTQGNATNYYSDTDPAVGYGYDFSAAAIPCTAVKTSDTSINSSKKYYIRIETDLPLGHFVNEESGQRYLYAEVETPSADKLDTYYEVTNEGKNAEYMRVPKNELYGSEISHGDCWFSPAFKEYPYSHFNPHTNLLGSYFKDEYGRFIKITEDNKTVVDDHVKFPTLYEKLAGEGILRQWDNTLTNPYSGADKGNWVDIGDEIVANKVTANYINTRLLNTVSITVGNPATPLLHADASANSGAGEVTIANWTATPTALYADDVTLDGAATATNRLYLSPRYEVNANALTFNDGTSTGFTFTTPTNWTILSQKLVAANDWRATFGLNNDGSVFATDLNILGGAITLNALDTTTISPDTPFDTFFNLGTEGFSISSGETLNYIDLSFNGHIKIDGHTSTLLGDPSYISIDNLDCTKLTASEIETTSIQVGNTLSIAPGISNTRTISPNVEIAEQTLVVGTTPRVTKYVRATLPNNEVLNQDVSFRVLVKYTKETINHNIYIIDPVTNQPVLATSTSTATRVYTCTIPAQHNSWDTYVKEDTAFEATLSTPIILNTLQASEINTSNIGLNIDLLTVNNEHPLTVVQRNGDAYNRTSHHNKVVKAAVGELSVSANSFKAVFKVESGMTVESVIVSRQADPQDTSNSSVTAPSTIQYGTETAFNNVLLDNTTRATALYYIANGWVWVGNDVNSGARTISWMVVYTENLPTT